MDKLKYKISSRATILLGRESVSKVDSAIIELVKNTYDSDASFCFLCIDTKNDNVYIIDNGVGMTREIIENFWMLIGTDNKQKEYRSFKGRVKSGEKGIGRFALDRLGNACDMYTQNDSTGKTIHWNTNWEQFEEGGKLLEEMSANIEELSDNFMSYLPTSIQSNIMEFCKVENHSVHTGTFFRISGLRDKWDTKFFQYIQVSLSYLLPPTIKNDDFSIGVMETINSEYILIENDITEEYDYKLEANFDGENFNIIIDRNEFDVDRIPSDVFKMEQFKKYPYRRQDFEKRLINKKLSISALLSNSDKTKANRVKKIGQFSFEYVFMKLSATKDILYPKEISRMRRKWMNLNAGIKLYRDNFRVRPYGEQNGNFDWLNLDTRHASNPEAVSSFRENWTVRNAQGYGNVFISRVYNPLLIDMSSREGLIENDVYQNFQEVLKAIISQFEKDRAYIAHTLKIYSNEIDEKENAKLEGNEIAKQILEKREHLNKEENNTQYQHTRRLAEAVQYYQEEREELVSEISLLRSLATNGLITSALVHDLKSIKGQLVNRVETFRKAIEINNEMLINRHLSALNNNDIFLKAWISVITTQTRADKRRRTKHNLPKLIIDIVSILEPILQRKKISIKIIHDKVDFERRVFPIDIESILYNLIINSMEAFESSIIKERNITIELTIDDMFNLKYSDNGKGIDPIFKDPYDIFKFGTTSKVDSDGDKIGTGLGMYIVLSTLREYNSTPRLIKWKNCFEMKFSIGSD